MKKLINISTLVCFGLLALMACDSQILNKEPLDAVSESQIWEDPALTEAFLNDIYVGMGHGFGETKMASHTDEANFIHGRGTIDVVQSNISPSNMGTLDDVRLQHTVWGTLYENIRSTNIFLNEIDDAAIGDQALRERMRGEAHFLRAYFYYILFRQWGGVPIINQVFSLDDREAMEVPRNSVKETVDFIISEADAAAGLLPLEYSGEDVGRATRGAALALKSRILLYAASDLYHDPSWAGGYGNPELISYQGANRQQMWRDAKNAAGAVMNLGIYSLYNENSDPVENYKELFMKNTSETIMSIEFNQDYPYEWFDADYGLFNGPNGYHNWGGNVPIQELVDDFDMADGSEFDWNNPSHAGNPYQNRDPRFYANILYDGAEWQERPPDVINRDPEGRVQTYLTYNVVDNSGNTISTRAGIDTRSSPIEDWNGTTTGYYVRKFMDPNINHQFEQQEVPWPYFRYSEILLNYAEASIELGEEGDARNALNQIRDRAGMPAFDATVIGQELLREARDERRIELMYEEHRYFDVRRWMLAPDVLNKNAMGINLTAERNENDPYTEYIYTNVERMQIQERSWANKMYFYPIPRDEMDRNDKLVQNPLYSTN